MACTRAKFMRMYDKSDVLRMECTIEDWNEIAQDKPRGIFLLKKKNLFCKAGNYVTSYVTDSLNGYSASYKSWVSYLASNSNIS
jgi:hypothetical protein